MKKVKEEAERVIEVMTLTQDRIRAYLLGDTPIILNSMSEKTRNQLLLPRPRMNAGERESSLKHNPVEEFRASAHQLSSGPTLLAIQASAFKRAISSAALDMPGARKATIGRLTYVVGDYVGIYGIPQLFMAPVRSADINRTPDIRTRCIIPRWCAEVDIRYVTPLLREKPVVNLLAAAGIYIGVGDWRPEKGAGNYGQFKMVAGNDKEFLEIVKTGGRKAQLAAMENPICYDDDTSKMLAWYTAEVTRRGFDKKKKSETEVDDAPRRRGRKPNGSAQPTEEEVATI